MRSFYMRSGKRIPDFVAAFPALIFVVFVGGGYYVYVANFCLHLIQTDDIVAAAILLTLYHLTLVLMLWSYVMVVVTDPGKVETESPSASTLPRSAAGQNVQSGQAEPSATLESGLVLGNTFNSADNKNASESRTSLAAPSSSSNTSSPTIKGGGVAGSPPSPRFTLQPVVVRIDNTPVFSSSSPTPETTTTAMQSQSQPSGTSNDNNVAPAILQTATAYTPNLNCSKCEIARPERSHHCRTCKRCVLRMDHHCPWVLNCVGQDNYKFFCLFVFYTMVHCVYIFCTVLPYFVNDPNSEAGYHQVEILAIVASGVFGFALSAFTITHLRLIFLNRTTIEDIMTPEKEGMMPCFQPGWNPAPTKSKNSDKEAQARLDPKNCGAERLYDLGWRANWVQIMGRGARCLVPISEARPLPGSLYNQAVLDHQWKVWYQRAEGREYPSE